MSGAAGQAELTAAEAEGLARQLFASIDQQDADSFAAFLADDAVFRFGNSDPVSGRAAIRDAVNDFFGSIAALSHRIERLWAGPGSIACAGEVTYTRHDGSGVTLPFADVFVIRDGQIAQYLIYIDIAPLYAS